MSDKKGRQPETAADKKIKRDFGVIVSNRMEKKEIRPSKLPDLLEEKGAEVSLATTKKWRGGAAIPGRPSELRALADVLDCDVDFLLGRSSEASRNQETAAGYTGMSSEAVEIVRNMDQAARRALESLIVAGAVLDPWDEYYQGRIDPPLPARGAAVAERDAFLVRLAGALDQRAQIGAQAELVEEDLQAGADVNLRNDLQLLRIRIEKQSAKRAELLRAFSAYIDRIFPEASEDQRILQEAEAKLRPLPPIGARRDFSEE